MSSVEILMAMMAKSRGNAKLPPQWPTDVISIKSPQYSKHLSQEVLTTIKPHRKPTTTVVDKPPEPSPSVRILQIKHPSHPAFEQHGLFASKPIAPDTLILFYLGFVHGPEHTDESSDHDICFDREMGLAIDAAKMGNEARFINDYRGTSHHGPNAEFRDCYVSVGQGTVEKRIGIFSLKAGKAGKHSKGIAKGEEILVSYGKGFWKARDR